MSEPYLEDTDFTLYNGDALEVLKTLPDSSVQMCVTSPPFYGLRDYGTGSWVGGNPDCDHVERIGGKQGGSGNTLGKDASHPNRESLPATGHALIETQYRETCGKCGASRVDQQIGLEETPEQWVEKLVAVFREVRRVLRADGVLWVEVGDSYNGAGSNSRTAEEWAEYAATYDTKGNPLSKNWGHGGGKPATKVHGLKPKDLIGAPWKLAEALRDPYYTGDIKAERDRVWLAATIDAEGSISGHRHTRKDDGRIRTGCHVTITNTSEALLDEAHRIWPASRVNHDPREGSLGSRPAWRWTATGVDRNAMLMRELYPHLIVKRRQAMLAYNLYELSRVSKRIGGTLEGKASREKRDWIVAAISTLNQGGQLDIPNWIAEPPSVFEPGWYLRSDIVWSRPNPMPESVTDRPTKSHSYVFLLSKSPRYFWDQEAIRETTGNELSWAEWNERRTDWKPPNTNADGVLTSHAGTNKNDGGRSHPAGRNVRSVWDIPTQPYPEAHFATYPEELVRRCILAGSSERGCCPVCGAPWTRETAVTYEKGYRSGHLGRGRSDGKNAKPADLSGYPALDKKVETLGWVSTCGCYEDERLDSGPNGDLLIHKIEVPCTVLDPFMGSGTTALVARKHGRRSIGIELSTDYCELAARRLAQQSLFA